ncbi:hypothetical protein SDC9_138412 [bioreactor metagenome]|uniref:Uncharacterized protein n=1 Tax=bioreactor metagenome TaxID=1076179 RepID=A0A645DP87_9ZZZZ
MEEVKLVKLIRCRDCVKYLERLHKAEHDFIQSRKRLMRCRGCERLQEAEAGKNEKQMAGN